jgi:putative transposase
MTSKSCGAVQESGFDGGKKVKGRKRTIWVDTMGLLPCETAHSANRSDHAGMMLLGVWFAAAWSCLELIWTDSTFGGTNFIAWVKKIFSWTLEVVKRSDDEKGFKVLPKRWVVERTFS